MENQEAELFGGRGQMRAVQYSTGVNGRSIIALGCWPVAASATLKPR